MIVCRSDRRSSSRCEPLLLGGCLILGLVVGPLLCCAQVEAPVPSRVELVEVEKGWALRVNGEPYFIKGAGGTEHLERLVEAGGNSIRTWGPEQARQVLDRAHELGLTVTVGIWFGHERHGFRYDDAEAVQQQLEMVRRVVEEFKDHPAVLMWGLGNEMEGEGDNELIWRAINDAAKLVKRLDPDHPTMTVIAEIGGWKLDMLEAHCPEIDVLGINAYGGLSSLAERLKDAGWRRPYVVTEFGPLGQWEVGHTSWGVPLEQTSTEKAKFYAQGYRKSIAGNAGRCLGGYVFHWGSKQEVTPTWYGLFIKETHETTEAVDHLARFWTGDWPANRAPLVRPIRLMGADPAALKAGQTYVAQVDAVDLDRDALVYEWVVQSETTDRREGGDAEAVPPVHPDLVLENGGKRCEFVAPSEPGPYRLYVYLRDGQGHAATANLPFQVVP